jgi:hypothetical protein
LGDVFQKAEGIATAEKRRCKPESGEKAHCPSFLFDELHRKVSTG